MRVDPDLSFEHELWKSGIIHVVGLDEAGRGALAGPVAVGAVILPNDVSARPRRHAGADRGASRLTALLRGVRDSKQMTPRQREEAVPRIKHWAVAWSVGFASPEEIDADGIVAAVRLAALRALHDLGIFPDFLLTDFHLELPELDVCQSALVRGDSRCLSIAAASVLAKTARDARMRDLDGQVPGYGLAKHKGYSTSAHRNAVRQMGRSTIHRRTFTIRS